MLDTDTPPSNTDQEREEAKALSSKRAERVALVGLVLLYLASAFGFAVVTPYAEAPDEYGHVAYIEYLVNFGELPAIEKQPYAYESFQPPLYYLVGALIVDAGRLLTGKRLDAPLAPPARARANVNPEIEFRVMVHPAEERWPFTVYALRTYSILLGLCLILLTYATARTLVPWPAPASVPLIATAFAALIPEANFIRASVSSENMADLTGALIVWLLVLHIMKPYDRRRVFWIGVALGLGFLAKSSLIPLLLPALLVAWARNEGRSRERVRDLLLAVGTAALVAGWLYVYRWAVYGDPLAYAATRSMIPSDSTYALADLFWFQEPFRGMLWKSFWGAYGWQRLFMPDTIYYAILTVVLLAVVGGVYLLARRELSRVQTAGTGILLLVVLLVYAFVVQASTIWVSWQGRETFPSLSSVCVLLGLGLGGLALGRGTAQPGPVKLWRFVLAQGLFAAVALGLLAVNIYSILWTVLPGLNP